MAHKTTIEWTGYTWNPVTGCDRVSPGCDHCYALTLAARLKAMGAHKGERNRYRNDGDPRTSGPGFGLTLHADLVDQPRHWREPRTVFVNSMSDLLHDRVPLAFVQAVFRTMAETPRHTYQVLTKRSARLTRVAGHLPWPPNVWMGVSVESQEYAIRARRLARVTGPAVRFLSVEPMLGPVDLWPTLRSGGIHWVIAGGESGPGYRPCDPDWLRSLRDQCARAGVAFFLKQLGGHPSKRAHELAVLDGERWTQMPARPRRGRVLLGPPEVA